MEWSFGTALLIVDWLIRLAALWWIPSRTTPAAARSWLLLVFFLPLLLAGLHLAFAFPFVHKLLLLFNLWNTRLLVGTTAASFLAFAVLYTLVYRITSNAYYHIVSGGGER